MSRELLAVFAFAGGAACGLLFARWYARHQVTGAVDAGLHAVGLDGGWIQNTADSFVPVVTG
jgi:hypothetical protein